MDRTMVNYFIDFGMAVTFVLLFVTGIIKFPWLLPSLGISYTGLPMNQINMIHDRSGVALGVLIIVHFLFHFKWMWAKTKSLFKRE